MTLRGCLLVTTVLLAVFSLVCSASSGKKKNSAYRDLNAIGHRVIGSQTSFGNGYSLDQEKHIGAQVSATYDKSTPLLHDRATEAYIDRLTRTISQNSDAQFPITTRVVDSADSFAVTLAGGYQYISRGLLLQMQNECELAAVIARGIAHTSLRSATGLTTRAILMREMSIPVMGSDGLIANSTSEANLSMPLTLLKFTRKDELAADYLGIQYLYKSGYSPECFLTFIRKVWPPQGQPTSKAFSPFPPLQRRLEALGAEINEILPSQSAAVTNTQDFSAFREHLLTLAPLPKRLPGKPTLLRPDQRKLN